MRMTSTSCAWSSSMPDLSPLLVPQMNVNDEHAVIVAWHVGSGARVAAEQVIATLETSKATFDVHADRAGAQPPQEGSSPVASSGSAGDGDERFTRKALRRMRELGLTVADFSGQGRIE